MKFGMISLFFILFGLLGCVYSLSAIYTKILLKRNGYRITWLITEPVDYMNLWRLAGKEKKHMPLFIIYISSTILMFLTLFIFVFVYM